MSLKSMLRENLVLVVGLTLPVLLIVLFFVASVLPKSMSAPPQYPMLFTTIKYESHPPEYLYDFMVKEHQLMVKARKNDQKERNYQSTRLMIYDARNESVREITVDPTKIADTSAGSEVALEETRDMRIDTASVAPDGFALEGPNYNGNGLLGGLFVGGYRNNNPYRLKKGSIGYKIPNTQTDYYYGQLQFIGWVVSK